MICDVMFKLYAKNIIVQIKKTQDYELILGRLSTKFALSVEFFLQNYHFGRNQSIYVGTQNLSFILTNKV